MPPTVIRAVGLEHRRALRLYGVRGNRVRHDRTAGEVDVGVAGKERSLGGDGLSASTQALEASLISATALACFGNGRLVENRREVAIEVLLDDDLHRLLRGVRARQWRCVDLDRARRGKLFEVADCVAAAMMVGLSEPATFSSAPA